MLDHARFPRLAQYIESLPQGLASFPECRARGSICRHLQEKSLIQDYAGLPPEMVKLLEHTVPQAGWVSECQSMGLHMAIGDAYRLGDAAYDRWLYEHNAGLLEGSFMFRKIMSLATPGVLMQVAAIRFNSFHQGTHLDVTSRAASSIDFQVSYPRGLYNRLCLTAYRAAFQAALDMTQAKNLRCELASIEPGLARYRLTWGRWE